MEEINISRMFWNDFEFHSMSNEVTVIGFYNCSFVNVIMNEELTVELTMSSAQVGENSEVIAP